MTPRTAESLYEVPPKEFVPARTALVRKLRDAGRRDEAAHVAAMRRPSPALWAVNQLGRREPDRVASLVQATQALRRTQRAAARGTSGDQFREAMREHREALSHLSAAARDALVQAGLSDSPAIERRIQATLQGAAAADAETIRRLRSGTLDEELSAPDFGALLGGPPLRIVPRAPPARREPVDEGMRATRTAAEPARQGAVAAREQKRRAAEERRQRMEERKRAVEEQRERARRDRELKSAERELKRLETIARRAEGTAARAKQSAESAEAKAKAARAKADEARRQVEALR